MFKHVQYFYRFLTKSSNYVGYYPSTRYTWGVFYLRIASKFPEKKKKSTYAEGLNEISYTYLCCQLSKQLCSFYPASRLPKKEFHRYSKIYTRSHVIWRIQSNFTAKWLVLYKLPKIKCLCYSKFILVYQVFDNLRKIHLGKSSGCGLIYQFVTCMNKCVVQIWIF